MGPHVLGSPLPPRPRTKTKKRFRQTPRSPPNRCPRPLRRPPPLSHPPQMRGRNHPWPPPRRLRRRTSPPRPRPPRLSRSRRSPRRRKAPPGIDPLQTSNPQTHPQTRSLSNSATALRPRPRPNSSPYYHRGLEILAVCPTCRFCIWGF